MSSSRTGKERTERREKVGSGWCNREGMGGHYDRAKQDPSLHPGRLVMAPQQPKNGEAEDPQQHSVAPHEANLVLRLRGGGISEDEDRNDDDQPPKKRKIDEGSDEHGSNESLALSTEETSAGSLRDAAIGRTPVPCSNKKDGAGVAEGLSLIHI